MNILLTGANGLIGQALLQYLQQNGHDVFTMQRNDTSTPFNWSPTTAHLWRITWDNETPIDAVIHLAGESIGQRRWTNAKKQHIRNSRLDSTRALVSHFRTLEKPPTVFLCASAIGYYGNSGEHSVNENSPAGKDFLAQLAVDWESCAQQAAEVQGIRTVNLRIGLVLAAHGGALKSMLPAFKLGLGGRIGNGQQWMSWVSLTEIVAMITFLLQHPQAHGAFNLVNPQAVTNADFTQALASAVGRSTRMNIPSIAVKAMFGEMGELLLLNSARVEPQHLQTLGFRFDQRDIRATLKELL